MNLGLLGKMMIVGASILGVSAAFAQQSVRPQGPRVDFGKTEYESKCATCHGLRGKGDGPMAGFVTRKVTDLTTLAKKNDGILPVSAMYDVIAGEQEVAAHGSRDMPVWGREYRMKAAEYYMEIPFDLEGYVRARILAIIEYINRLQVK